jgi:signal transduction histidine kinase
MRNRAAARSVSPMPAPVDPAVRLVRVPRRIPRVDYLIAGGLLVWALLEAVLGEALGSVPLRVLFAIGVTVPLAFRRRFPFPALAAIVLITLLRGLTGDVPEEGVTPFPSLLVASFSAAIYARPVALAYAAAPLPILAIAFGGHGPLTAVDYAILSFLSLGAWTGGWLVRHRAEQVEAAVAASGELAASAVAEERERIARELHDVVAHSVSIVAVQAGAAEELLESDPDRARQHLGAVRGTAREALTEMRHLLDVLRTDDADYAPQPGLGRLQELVAETRSAGLPVELAEVGVRPHLSPGLDVAAFRIIQESLTNVRKHAGDVPTRVRLRYGRGWLELEVENEPGRAVAASNGSRRGLVGMRERARLYGGNLEAGPADGGGFRVRATLPLQGAAQ